MPIAIDTTSQNGNQNGTSVSWSHTCTGSNLTLWVAVKASDGADTITGVTYNGVSMSLINKTTQGVNYIYLFGLANPSTGANSITVSASPATTIRACAASYTGCSASIPDSQNIGSATSTTLTVNTTVVASNCWLVGAFADGNDNLGAGASTTLRVTDGVFGNTALFDSNGTVGTGTQGLTVTPTGSNALGGVVASIAPFTAPATSSPIPQLLLLGVG